MKARAYGAPVWATGRRRGLLRICGRNPIWHYNMGPQSMHIINSQAPVVGSTVIRRTNVRVTLTSLADARFHQGFRRRAGARYR